jgi:CHASE3 domain sensor protein
VTKRKEYLAVRKQKLKAIGGRQKAELARVKDQIKSLPKKHRTAKGKELRAAIRAKYKKMRERIPASAKKSMGEIVNLIKSAKVLRV